MKKTLCQIILMIILVSALAACADSIGNTDGSAVENLSTASYIELPSYLVIEKELPDDYSKEAITYEVEMLEFDEAKIVSAFLSAEPDEQIDNAYGVQYVVESSMPEYLTIGNKKDDTINFIKIGDYILLESDIHTGDLKNDISKETDHDNNASVRTGNESFLSFGETSDLSFKPREEIIVEMESRFLKAGFPEVHIRHMYSRDCDTLNKNLEIYNRSMEERDKIIGIEHDDIIFTYTEADEDYSIYYEQRIDGIPVITKIWTGNGINRYLTELHVVYSERTGFEQLRAGNLYQIISKKRKVPVHSPEEALNVYIKEYSKSLHFRETRVTDAELNYVIVSENNRLTAVPAWVFSLAEEGENTEKTSSAIYENIVINAETLEYLTAEDQK